MQKVIVTKSGKPCFISGPGAKNITITAYNLQGEIDTVVEEFEVVAPPEEIEQLRKINKLDNWRKKAVRELYKRGKNKKEDEIRDRNAKASVRLPS